MIYPVPKLAAASREDNLTTTERMALLAATEKRELVTVAMAARLLGNSRDTLYRWLNEGRLEGRKVRGRWLVYKDAVEKAWKEGLAERE